VVLTVIALGSRAQTISIETTTANIGTVARGARVQQSFMVKNTGKADLRILDVKPGCGCTTVDFDKTIHPGSEGMITLTVDTKSFHGAISKSAVVSTNDPVTPQTTLIVTANVRGYVTASPAESIRIETAAGHAGAGDLVLASSNPDFKPSNVTTSEKYLRATLSPDQGSNRWKLIVTLDSSAPIGPLAGSVTIRTGIAEEPEFRIPVSGVIRAEGKTLVAAVAGPASAASAPENQDQELDLTTQDILAQDKLTLQAMMHKDMGYLDKHIAPDAVFKSMGKQLTKRMMLAQVMEQPEPAGQVRERFSKVSSHTSGDVVSVTATVTLSMLNGGSWFDFYEAQGTTRYRKVDGEWVTLGADNEYEKPIAHRPLVSNNRPTPEQTAPPPPPAPAEPCAGVEMMGLYKVDMRPASPLIVYQAKVRNGSSVTRIVAIGWQDLYGQEQQTAGQVKPGDIATFNLGPQKPFERQPIDLRVKSCE
jgi:hypothetical protein